MLYDATLLDMAEEDVGRWRTATFREWQSEELDLRKLSEGERNQLRIIVASRGNRLLYRCPPALHLEIQALL